MGLFLLNLHML